MLKPFGMLFLLVASSAWLFQPGQAQSETNLVRNGDFGNGLSDWTTVSAVGFGSYPKFQVLTETPPPVECMPSERRGNPFLSIDVPFGTDGYVEQEVAVPASGAQLSFLSWGWEGNNPDLGFNGLVDAYARIVDARGFEQTLETYTPPPMFIPGGGIIPDVCTGNSPVSKSYDLSAYSRQTVKLRIGATSPNCCGTLALFDDLQVSATGSVLRQFHIHELPSGPDHIAIGLAFDGTFLYYSGGYQGDSRIWKVSTTGTLLGVIQTNPAFPVGGLAWNGSYLLAGVMFTSPTGDSLFAVDPVSGQASPIHTDSSYRGIDGLAYDSRSGTIWLGTDFGNRVFQLSTSGTVLRTINTEFGTSGVEFDGRGVWIVDPTARRFNQYSLDGTKASSIDAFDLFHEDLAFDSVTFAPKCALWSIEAYQGDGLVNRITATETPCSIPLEPDFEISVSPQTRRVFQRVGFEARFEMSVHSLDGFVLPVQLSLVSPIRLSHYTFEPNNLSPDYTSTLRILAFEQGTPTGRFTFTVIGTASNGLQRTADFTIVVWTKWAVVIGINDYSGTSDLRGAVNDALNVAGLVLGEWEFPPFLRNVHVVTDNTGSTADDIDKQTIMDELSYLQANAHEDDIVLFYISSHGVRVPLTSNEPEYIVPHLSCLSSAHPVCSTEELISDDEFADAVGRIDSQRLVIILDVSLAGGFISDNLQQADLAEGSPVGRIVVTGCTEAINLREDCAEYASVVLSLQFPFIHGIRFEGLFTHFFVEAFARGDANSDGHVSMGEAYVYTFNQMARFRFGTSPQRPQMYYGIDADLFLDET